MRSLKLPMRMPGLALYQSRRIDCVILDLDLPKQSGFELLIELVRIASRPKVAVIILTHNADPRVRELALENGAHEGQFCSKNVSFVFRERLWEFFGIIL